MLRPLLTAVLSLSAAVLAQGAPPQHDQLNAVLWMQRAAEYKAACLQAFAAARTHLGHALDDPKWTACLEQQNQPLEELPPAIVADVDETLLDNSALNARLILDPARRFGDVWNEWMQEQQAPPLPGALAFSAFAQQRGVRLIYITNRAHDTDEAPTRANLLRLGFPVVERDGEDVVLCAGEIGDKSARRAAVAKKYRILLLLGDNLADFAPGVEARKDAPQGKVAEARAVELHRDGLVRDFTDWWGTRWILLPNPVYGSWQSLIAAQAQEPRTLLRTLEAPPKEPAKERAPAQSGK